MGVSAEAERVSVPFLCLFAPLRPSSDWIMPIPMGQGHLLHSVY